MKNNLTNFIENRELFKISILEIQQFLADEFGISVKDLSGKKRHSEMVNPRHIAVYICRVFRFTHLQIARKFNKKDHSSTINSEKVVKQAMRQSQTVENFINYLVNKIKLETSVTEREVASLIENVVADCSTKQSGMMTQNPLPKKKRRFN